MVEPLLDASSDQQRYATYGLVYCSQSDLTVSTHPPFDEVLIGPSLWAWRQVRTTCLLAKSETIAEKEVDSTCLPLTFCAASAIVCLRQVRTAPRYSRRHRRSCSGFCCQLSLLGPPLMRNLPAGFVVSASARAPWPAPSRHLGDGQDRRSRSSATRLGLTSR